MKVGFFSLTSLLRKDSRMKPRTIFTVTAILFVLCVVWSAPCLLLVPYEKGYSITSFVEDCDLVVYGDVIEKQSVSRPGCTTDITIQVIEVMKGTPNAGAKRVKFMLEGGECDGSISIAQGEPEFELEERVILFLKKSTRPWLPHGGYYIFRVYEGKLPVERGRQVLILYTLDNDVTRASYLPVKLVIQIAKAAAKNPEAARQLEAEIKAHIPVFQQFTDHLKHEAKAIQAAAPLSTTEEKVIQFSNMITGLDRFASMHITAAPLTLSENDDTPILSIKKRLSDSKHLWKVSYQVDALRYENKVNPHIVGFDVYVDIARGHVLKIVSRAAEGLAEVFRKGIEVSNQQIRSIFRHYPYIMRQMPASTPAFTLRDLLVSNDVICRHYECYYILYREPDGDKPDKVFPMWLVILYGTEPIEPLKPHTLADGYVRTFETYFVNAVSGEGFPFVHITGENTDTFK